VLLVLPRTEDRVDRPIAAQSGGMATCRAIAGALAQEGGERRGRADELSISPGLDRFSARGEGGCSASSPIGSGVAGGRTLCHAFSLGDFRVGWIYVLRCVWDREAASIHV